MRYNRYNRSKPTPRDMTVKYAGNCACCGVEIKAGEWATYYPPGTIAGVTVGKIAHVGGLEGTGQRCYVERCRKMKAEGKASTLYPDVPGDPRRELDAPGAAAKGWVASKRPGSAADLDAFDHYLARVTAWVQDGSEAFAVAMLRVRESDLGETYSEIPF